MFGDTDVPAAFQSGIVNETLGRSRIHDAVGVIHHRKAQPRRIRFLPFPAVEMDQVAAGYAQQGIKLRLGGRRQSVQVQ